MAWDFLLGKTTAELDKKTLDRLQEIQKLPDDERKMIYKVLDSLLRDAKAKQAYAALKTKPGSLFS
jgi:hypothetical protein